jgi:hypothetical protein
MPYFLDGNNLIGRRDPTEEDRAALIGEISARLRATRARAVLFFDGANRRESFLGPLRVREGFGASADNEILREIAASRSPQEIVLVTADRGLASRARDAGASVLDPSAFWERFGRESPRAGKDSQKVDIEDWLRYFSDDKNRGL